MGGHSLSGACGHSKTYEISLFPHQRKLSSEGLLGRHALGLLGRTLEQHKARGEERIKLYNLEINLFPLKINFYKINDNFSMNLQYLSVLYWD